MDLERYEPSGKFSLIMIPGFVIAAAALAVCAGGYQALQGVALGFWWHVVVLVVLSGVVGAVSVFLVTGGRCRSTPVAVGVSVSLALVTVAASWCWAFQPFANAIREQAPDLETLDLYWTGVPSFVSYALTNRWSANGAPLPEAVVVGFWLAEVAAVVGFTLVMLKPALGQPYCERCDATLKTRTLGLGGMPTERAEQLVQQGNLAGLVGLINEGNAGEKQVVLSRSACESCPTAFLSVIEVTYLPGRKERRRVIAKHLVLPRELSDRLLARITERDAA
jgi:hypothetical protein